MPEHHDDEQVAAVVAVLAEHYWNDTRGDSGDEGGKWWRCRPTPCDRDGCDNDADPQSDLCGDCGWEYGLTWGNYLGIEL